MPGAESISDSRSGMRFLVDTCILSDGARREKYPEIFAWLNGVDPVHLAASVLTFGEILGGIEGVADRQRRLGLERWLAEELYRQFEGRILPVDRSVAEEWGRLAGAGRRRGRPLSVIDGLLAATARVYGLTVVTRNVRHFAGLGVEVESPYRS
jgi:predicted nucleic acid-binding protein